jgi:hypothetical protein
MEEQRRQLERKAARMRRREHVREDVGKVLPIAPQWWGDDEWQAIASGSDEDESEGEEIVLVGDTFHVYVGWLANTQKDPFIPVHEYARIFSSCTSGDLSVANN